MGSTSSLGFIMALMFPMLGGNDLLDFMPAADYWADQKVAVTTDAMLAQLRIEPAGDVAPLIKQLGADEFRMREDAMRKISAQGPGVIPQLQSALAKADAETADRIKTLLKRFGDGQRSAAERRLMAIRTLGELKDRKALERLRELMVSKDPFVGEYAERAIAVIEGKTIERRPPTAKQLDDDLGLLSEKCRAVVQMSNTRPLPIGWKELTERLSKVNSQSDRRALLRRYQRTVHELGAMLGNVRIDAVTVGMGGLMYSDDGYFVFVFRGKCDRAAIRAAAIGHGGSVTKQAEMEVVQLANADQGQLFLASDERVVLVMTTTFNRRAIADEMLSALRRGMGTLDKNEKLSKAVALVDRGKPLWGAMIIDEQWQGMLGIEGLETATLEIGRKENALSLKAMLLTKDGATARAGVERLESFRALGKGLEQASVAADKHLAPAFDLVKSLEIKQAENAINLSANTSDATGLLLIPAVETLRWLTDH